MEIGGRLLCACTEQIELVRHQVRRNDLGDGMNTSLSHAEFPLPPPPCLTHPPSFVTLRENWPISEKDERHEHRRLSRTETTRRGSIP